MLAFWKHGLKGKSFHSNEVMMLQDLCQSGTEELWHGFFIHSN